ncbi:complement factor H-like, partial [Polyodon spathula]|uniref:complement factor H-like n=1 Tax=Polyodon spathula TaxID=7913 RepID=UPI001B7E9519
HQVLLLIFGSASVIVQTLACNTPPVVDNAYISQNEKNGKYSEGDVVYYTCHPGYISRGRLLYKCQDGEWTQSRLLKCTPKPCEHPGDIINGNFHLVNSTEFLYGVQVQYTCNEGYQMASQMDFRICLENGWSNAVPHCEVKTCIPQKPATNVIITSGKFEPDEPIPYGNVLKFECSSSDFIIDGESEVYCKADGNWSIPFPKCKELKCPSPPNIDHGSLVQASQNEYAHDQRVEYQCDEFYQIQGSTFIRCIHGKWSIPPSCIERCGRPPVVDNAVIIQRIKLFYDNNDQVAYQCKRGYKFQGHYSYKYIRCLHGKWSNPPECLRSTCDPPPAVDNAEIINGERRYYEDNDWIQYQCVQGYRLEGSYPYSTCLQGKWSNAPKCISLRPKCGLPPAVANAVISRGAKREYRENDWIEYQCNLGYEFEGSYPYSTCLHGKWSSAPTCISSRSGSGLECGLPPLVNNAIIEQKLKTSGVYKNGEMVTYKCQNYYVLKGSNQASCNRGTWERLPICLEPCIVTANDMKERNIRSRQHTPTSTVFIKYDSTVEFECTHGATRNSSSLTGHCHKGQRSLPTCIKAHG